MNFERHVDGRWRLVAASSMLLAGTCLAAPAGVDVGAVTTDGNGQPLAPRCSDQFHEARVIEMSAAAVPDAIWEQKPNWNATVRFQVDGAGSPVGIKATVTSDVDGKYALERFTTTALARYRFCLPQDATPDSRWKAHMRFAYTRLGAQNGRVETYVQQIVPSYTRTELREGRAGTVRVRGTFAVDGRATSVDVVESSGDAALDAKSLEAMAEYLLVFREPRAVTRPVVFEQPYKFQPH